MKIPSVMQISTAIAIFSILLSCGEPKSDESEKGNNGGVEESQAKVEVYTYPEAITASNLYSVSVDGTPTFVYPTSEPHFAVFGANGKVKVRIRHLKTEISSVVVRPISKNYAYSFTKNEVTVTLEPYDRIDVEINGKETNPLFIFVNPLEQGRKPSKIDPNVIYFEAGKIHTPDAVYPKSGQTVYIEGGAVVKAPIWFRSVNNVAMKGCGIVDGMDFDGKIIFSNKCDGVELENVTVLNASSWTTLLTESNNIKSTNYKAIAIASSKDAGNENDSFDLLGCRNATVKQGFSYSHDDTFCIKAQKWDYCGEVKNISFQDCIAWNYDTGNSFEIGYELNQNVSNVSYKNIYAIHSAGKLTELRRGAISIHQGAAGIVSDISYENVYIEDPKEYGIYFSILQASYEIGTGVVWAPGIINGVKLKNIHFLKQPPKGHIIKGYNSTPNIIDNLEIENLTIGGVKITDSNKGSYKINITNANVTFK